MLLVTTQFWLQYERGEYLGDDKIKREDFGNFKPGGIWGEQYSRAMGHRVYRFRISIAKPEGTSDKFKAIARKDPCVKLSLSRERN